MSTSRAEEVNALVGAVASGDRSAAERLFPLVYDELRQLAESRLRGLSPGASFQPTMLVHEAYLRLIGAADGTSTQEIATRPHFLAAAAVAMRHVLVDAFRHKGRLKRGGDRDRVPLLDEQAVTERPDVDFDALDAALTRLKAADPLKADIVVMRFFGGMTHDEIAAATSLSPATIDRHWSFARAWMRRELEGPGSTLDHRR